MYEQYRELVKMGKKPQEALDELGLERYCCRRMIISYADLITEIKEFD